MPALSTRPSQVFLPYRPLGYVTNYVPFVLQRKGSEFFLTTSVGNAFHIYNCKKLQLLFVGPQLEQDISCLTAYNDFTIAAAGTDLLWFLRGKLVKKINSHQSPICLLYLFGETLISISDGKLLKLHSVTDGELCGEIDFSQSFFTISALTHPSTYLNKILLGSVEGKLQLWNIRSRNLVYEFSGWNSEVVCLVSAPAVDVVGVGLQNGHIIIHNIRFDQMVVSFHQEYGPVTAIAFRTDEHAVLVTASGGRLLFWSLEQRRLISALTEPHCGQVTCVEYLPSQPVLVTIGSDNSIKMWISDRPDANPRLLRSRSGHSAPPVKVRHYDEEGRYLLSSGMDKALRLTCSLRDSQNVEFSQGHLLKRAKKLSITADDLKFSPIVDFASCAARERDWDNIVTCHLHELEARTWKFADKVIGSHVLKPPFVVETSVTGGEIDIKGARVPSTPSSFNVQHAAVARRVELSACGNFAFIGLSNGQVDKYNMQSGLHRGMYGRPAHSGAIRGICTDATNARVITVCANGKVKFWDFETRKCLGEQNLGAPVAHARLHRPTNMLALVCDNFVVRVYDAETQQLMRTFRGHANRITDVDFSPDGRWLVSASMDGSVRIWDIPSGRLLDAFLVCFPVTSLSFAPTGQYLATSHVDHLGIFLWANKTLFSNSQTAFLPDNFQPNYIEMPSIGTSCHSDEEDWPASVTFAEDESLVPHPSPNQLGVRCLTLSLKPMNYWQTLSQLDLIKERNKPVEAPQKAPKAPFFLSTLPGLTPKFALDETQEELQNILNRSSSASRVLAPASSVLLPPLQTFLCSSSSGDDSKRLTDVLGHMTPSAVDLEIRTIKSAEALQKFMKLVNVELLSGRNFELLETYMSIFLKQHGRMVAENTELLATLEKVQLTHKIAWSNVSNLLNHSLCLIEYLKNL